MKNFLLCFMIIFTAALPCKANDDFQKTKIAVVDFQIQGQGFRDADMGQIVAEWLVTAFVKNGRFDVVERRLLKKIIAEQTLSTSGLIDAKSATKLGKMLGVKIVISGSVIKVHKFLEVNARIIDVESGSIVAAETVKSASAVQLEELVVQMAVKIINDFPLEGYIVYRDGNNIRVDLGKQTGVKRGMQFVVFKEGKIIRHPKTGEVLDVDRVETGIIEIRDVRAKLATAKILKEKKPDGIAYGQRVKSVARALSAGQPRQPAPVTSVSPDLRGQLAEVEILLNEAREAKKIGGYPWKAKQKELFVKLKMTLSYHKKSAKVYYCYAKAFNLCDKPEKAVKYLDKAVYFDPLYVDAYELKGDYSYSIGKNAEMKETYEKSRKRKKYMGKVIEAYQGAINIRDDIKFRAMMYYKMGCAYNDVASNKNMAINYLTKAVATAPRSEAGLLSQSKLAQLQK